mgnify:CR=1 FL=1
MLSQIIQVTVISIIFILVVDNIYQFLKDTLTIPKKHDLIHVPNEKYKKIFDLINTTGNVVGRPGGLATYSTQQDRGGEGTTDIRDIPLVPDTALGTGTPIDNILPYPTKVGDHQSQSMKNELKNFMKKQLSSNGAVSSVPNFT